MLGEKFVLTKEDLQNIYKEAAAIGAKEALRATKEMKNKETAAQEDKRFRNTKLLLKNYRALKLNAENSVFGRTQMQESAADILREMGEIYSDETIIESIKQSATRTAIIVGHIEKMLEIYQAFCEKSVNTIEKRRYNVIKDRFIIDKPLSVSAIAHKYNISKESVYIDINAAVGLLSTLIFGIDSMV